MATSADKKVSDLPAAASLDGTEIVYLSQDGIDKQATAQLIATQGRQLSQASILLGRGAGSGGGQPQELTLGTGLSMSGTTLNAQTGGDARTSNPLSQFASTTSAQLATVITDETGAGALVFANGPTLVNPTANTQAVGTNNTTLATTAFVLANASAGSGTVTSVSTSGTRVTGTVTNPTTTPNIALALANTSVTPGSYTNANITVQADGTITAASNGGGGGGGSGFLFTSNVWVDVNGSDSTGVAGDMSHPFKTINAALDATTGPTVINLGFGTFDPVQQDSNTPGGSTLNPSSKLRSDLWFKGSGRPALDSPTSPTSLVGGTVIKGPMRVHSTRHNMKFTDLGIDSGSAVCGSLYSSAAQDGLFFNNVTQTAGLAPSRRPQVVNVIALCQSPTALVHPINFENCIDVQSRGLEAYYGIHGVVVKSSGGYIDGLVSKGHANNVILFKDGGGGLDVAKCGDFTMTNVSGGSFSSGDTPYGVVFDSGGSRTVQRIAVSGIVLTGIGSNELLSLNSGGVVSTPLSNIRLDNFFSDSGNIRSSLASGSDKTSIFINGSALQPPGTLPTSGLWEAGGLNRYNSSYSGASIRVRRSSDNTEQDIYFNNNLLDSSSLLSFVGSGSGYVTTIYGQYNNHNIVQSNTAKQPRIVNSGVYESTGIYFDGSSYGMNSADSSTGTNTGLTLIFSGVVRSQTTVQVLFEHNSADTNNDAVIFTATGSNNVYVTMTYSSSSNARTSQFNDSMTTQTSYAAVFDRLQSAGSDAAKLYDAGTQQSPAVTSQSGTMSGSFPSAIYSIGSRGSASLYSALSLKGFAIYETALTSSSVASASSLMG